MSAAHPIPDETLAEQAEQIRASFPELYAFLADPQREMRRVLAGIPDPADPETPAPADALDEAIAQLRRGIASIGTVLTGSAAGGGQR